MIKYLISTALLCSAIGIAGSQPASAMPIDNLADKAVSNMQEVRWICIRHHCWHTGPRLGAYAYAPGVRLGHRHHRWWKHRY